MVASDWWTHILQGASFSDPNLDDPRNVTTLKNLVNRYDVFIINSPDWHEVGWQVRDRLKLYASEAGRTITCFRYLGTMCLRWGDQAGGMSVVPVGNYVSDKGVVSDSSVIIKDTADNPCVATVGAATYLLDPAAAKTVAGQHCLAMVDGTGSRNKGWDGVFLDEMSEVVAPFNASGGTLAKYPDTVAGRQAYQNAKISLAQSVVTALHSHGKLVAANITPNYSALSDESAPNSSLASFWPYVLTKPSGIDYPFSEIFATNWDHTIAKTGTSDYDCTVLLLDFMDWCGTSNAHPIVNVYSNEAAVLRYGAAFYLMGANGSTYMSGSCPTADANDEYAVLPTWLPEFDADIGAPAGERTVANNRYQRQFANATATVDAAAGTSSIA